MFYLYKEKIKLDRSKIDVQKLMSLTKDLDDSDALMCCLYVWLAADSTEDNPLRDLDPEDRRAMAADIAFGGLIISVDPGELMAAVEEYQEKHTDRLQREVNLFNKKMFQFRDLLKKTKPKIYRNEHKISGNISFTSNIDIITSILDNVIKIIIDKAVMVGMQKSGKFVQSLRGGLSPNMKGKTKQIKD